MTFGAWNARLMMMEYVEAKDLVAMLRGAVESVRRNLDLLTKLDSAIGDGDHGLAMGRAMDALEKAVTENSTKPMQDLLTQVGWDIMGIDGGSTGPLLGSFFMGMGDGIGAAERLDRDSLCAAFAAARTSLAQNTKATVGDKTLMDALLPALEAMNAAPPQAGILGCLKAGADAAATGAQATETMVARFGRARNLGERTLGHLDPGATSFSLIMAGFHHGLSQNE